MGGITGTTTEKTSIKDTFKVDANEKTIYQMSPFGRDENLLDLPQKES